MRAAVVLLAVLAAGVVGLVVTGLLEDTTQGAVDDDAFASGALDDDTASSSVRDDATADPSPSSAPQDVDAVEPLVPRVLPPDAALEDVRDAVAARDADAVRDAYARISRMSQKSASFAASLRALAGQEGDRIVALIVARAIETPWNALGREEQDALLASMR